MQTAPDVGSSGEKSTLYIQKRLSSQQHLHDPAPKYLTLLQVEDVWEKCGSIEVEILIDVLKKSLLLLKETDPH